MLSLSLPLGCITMLRAYIQVIEGRLSNGIKVSHGTLDVNKISFNFGRICQMPGIFGKRLYCLRAFVIVHLKLIWCCCWSKSFENLIIFSSRAWLIFSNETFWQIFQSTRKAFQSCLNFIINFIIFSLQLYISWSTYRVFEYSICLTRNGHLGMQTGVRWKNWNIECIG